MISTPESTCHDKFIEYIYKDYDVSTLSSFEIISLITKTKNRRLKLLSKWKGIKGFYIRSTIELDLIMLEKTLLKCEDELYKNLLLSYRSGHNL